MKKKIFFGWLSIIFLTTGCIISKNRFCAKRYMNNHKFIYLSSDNQLTSKYFIIKDDIQLEYSDSDLYSNSFVKWKACDEYYLIINQTYYREGGLQQGDTLFVKLQTFNNDTVSCSATAYNQTFIIKLLKTKINLSQ